MHLSTLRLYNYRNLTDTTVTFSPGVNFVVGRNGQGKTNLLEAVSFLATSRSFRTTKVRELLRWDTDQGSVFGAVQHDGWDVELGIALEKQKRRAFVNGDEVRSLASYLEKFVAVSFAPTDLEIIKGGPTERRRFLDRHLSSYEPKVFESLMKYTRLLKNKAALLKEPSTDRAKVEAWNELLGELCVELYTERKRFLSLLQRAAQTVLNDLAPFDGELELTLKSNISEDPEVVSPESVRAQFNAVFDREIQQQRTIVGCHRDEVEISIGGMSARSFASQGQTRSIVLALIIGAVDLLAEKINEAPVLLLDDVESELDPNRTRALFEVAFSKKCQVIVSGTDPRFFEEYSGERVEKLITISGGAIEESAGQAVAA